ncbi:uncharacterized protein JCM15063_003261 [Sporobolomyces koalae]|uniref:uncharacterized protein n=1 Tax=Sporobolomyces koalae TaxID=500713 RepID=UPI00317AE2E2
MTTPVTVKAWSHFTPPFPTTLQQTDVSPPTADRLGPNDILVEVHAAALNPVDVQLVNLSIFRLPALQAHRSLGKDFAGTLLAKGSAVDDDSLVVGDCIMGFTLNPLGTAISGTLSQVAVFDTTRSCVIKKPTNLSDSQAASLPLVFLTAVTTLSPPHLELPKSSGSKPTVVVLGGSSAVGIYVIQYASLKLGLDVIATCSNRNAEFVRSLGARETIDYTTESVPERLAQLRPVEGYISIIDCVGGTELFSIWSDLLHPRTNAFPKGGNYTTIVGDKTLRSAIGGSITNWYYPKQALRTWRGWFGWAPRYACITLDARKASLLEIEPLVNSGMQVVVDSEYEFQDVPKAFEKLNTGRARGKVVVHVKPR